MFFSLTAYLPLNFKNELLNVFFPICQSYSFLSVKTVKLDQFSIGEEFIMNQKWFMAQWSLPNYVSARISLPGGPSFRSAAKLALAVVNS